MKEIRLYIYGRCKKQSRWEIDSGRVVNRLYYVNSGSATILNNAVQYTLTANKIYIIPSCKDFQPVSADNFDHTYFDFYSSRILHPEKIIELDGSVLSAHSFFHYINGLLEQDVNNQLQGAMEEFLCAFLTLVNEKHAPLPYITNAAVTRAVNIIHDEYPTITTRLLAKKLNLNESYTIRLFSSVMGISPMKYIRAVRVSRGKELIRGGESVSAAAEQCGYSSPSAFYNAVMAELNTAPSQLSKK